MQREQLTREYQDKRLRVEFTDGQVADLLVSVVCECTEHEDCRGIVFDIISTNRPERLKDNSAYWAEMKDIKSFELIGDSLA